MKAHLEGLSAYHDNYQPYDEHVRPEIWTPENKIFSADHRAAYKPVLHPVVRTHPKARIGG